MWRFFIILLAFIVIKFIYDTAKQSAKIKKEGGVRKKYAILINHFLSGHKQSQIFQDDNTLVSVGVMGIAGSQIYFISPAYGNVSIRMEIKNNPLFGNTKMEWLFPEDMDQNLMIERIEQDIKLRFMNLYNNL
ncbi:MAG: hypothetical protein K2G15_03985 [Muribaculaceae bacterium]|nr:hypothetical protein [Muribaculaceae bacterium]